MWTSTPRTAQLKTGPARCIAGGARETTGTAVLKITMTEGIMMTEGMGVGIDGSELVGAGEVITAEATQLGLGTEGKAGGLSRGASGVRSPGRKGGRERKRMRLPRRLASGCKSNLAFCSA